MTSTSVRSSGVVVRQISGQRPRRTVISWFRARAAAGARGRYLAAKRRHEAEPVTDAYVDRWPALPLETSISIVQAMGMR